MSRLVKRRIWLVVAVAALFSLQAPLCALACLTGGDAQTTVAAGHDDAPCHEPAPTSPAPEPESSRDDCGCEDAYAALTPAPDAQPSSLAPPAALPPSASAEQLAARVGWPAASVLAATDLPPPDILLLNSTLLL